MCASCTLRVPGHSLRFCFQQELQVMPGHLSKLRCEQNLTGATVHIAAVNSAEEVGSPGPQCLDSLSTTGGGRKHFSGQPLLHLESGTHCTAKTALYELVVLQLEELQYFVIYVSRGVTAVTAIQRSASADGSPAPSGSSTTL